MRFSDCTLLAGINFGRLYKWELPTRYKQLCRWYDTDALRHL